MFYKAIECVVLNLEQLFMFYPLEATDYLTNLDQGSKMTNYVSILTIFEVSAAPFFDAFLTVAKQLATAKRAPLANLVCLNR
jgi:hypothetical protein